MVRDARNASSNAADFVRKSDFLESSLGEELVDEAYRNGLAFSSKQSGRFDLIY
jgi:hypothetical protein